MSEQSIVQARASVMLYNNETKSWEHSGGSSGISRVHVYHHPLNNTYRIVGRKAQDHAVVINCALVKGLKYNEATPTFHQWRDQRQVYGLNFPSKEDAQVFGQAVVTALENLRSGAAVPQQQQQLSSHMSNGRNEPDEMLSHHRDQPHYDAHDHYNRGRAPSAGPDRSYHNQYDVSHERESPSSSTAALSTSPGPQPVIQSSAPPAPPAPPTPPAPPAAPPAPPAPPAAPPLPAGGGPPAPPPPPPAPSGGGGGTLADQIAAAKLKKASKAESEGVRSDRSNSTSRGGGKGMGGGGGMDMMAEMAKKLAARKAKEEGREVEPVREEVETRSERTGSRSSVSNPPPAPAFGNNNPKANFLTPAKPSSNGGIRKSSKSESTPLSNDQLEELKTELLAEFRQELDAAKKEIIEAVRQEILRLR